MSTVVYNPDMARKGKPKQDHVEPKATTDERSKTRPGWMIRLKEKYKPAVENWQKQFKKETGVEPDLVDLVHAALDEVLRSKGINPNDYENN